MHVVSRWSFPKRTIVFRTRPSAACLKGLPFSIHCHHSTLKLRPDKNFLRICQAWWYHACSLALIPLKSKSVEFDTICITSFYVILYLDLCLIIDLTTSPICLCNFTCHEMPRMRMSSCKSSATFTSGIKSPRFGGFNRIVIPVFGIESQTKNAPRQSWMDSIHLFAAFVVCKEKSVRILQPKN